MARRDPEDPFLYLGVMKSIQGKLLSQTERCRTCTVNAMKDYDSGLKIC